LNFITVSRLRASAAALGAAFCHPARTSAISEAPSDRQIQSRLQRPRLVEFPRLEQLLRPEEFLRQAEFPVCLPELPLEFRSPPLSRQLARRRLPGA